MKNNSNVYDIDGELIRSIKDEHHWSVDEAREQIKKYREKLEKLPENDPKIQVYNTYIGNLTSYIMNEYSKMSKDQLTSELSKQITLPTTSQEEVNKALTELAGDIPEPELPEQPELVLEKPLTQEDMLVERENVSNINEEYVDFEEQ